MTPASCAICSIHYSTKNWVLCFFTSDFARRRSRTVRSQWHWRTSSFVSGTIGPRSTINRKLKKKKWRRQRTLCHKIHENRTDYGPKTDQYERNDLSKAFNPIRMSKKWWVLIHQTREVEWRMQDITYDPSSLSLGEAGPIGSTTWWHAQGSKTTNRPTADADKNLAHLLNCLPLDLHADVTLKTKLLGWKESCSLLVE